MHLQPVDIIEWQDEGSYYRRQSPKGCHIEAELLHYHFCASSLNKGLTILILYDLVGRRISQGQ